MGDLGEPALARAIVERHAAAYGRLDVLVNNAGVGVSRPLGEMTDKQIDLQYAVNLRAPIGLYRAALPLLEAAGREPRGAVVVNVASLSGKRSEPYLSVYSAVKAGVVAFTASMNRELGASGIRSTALCPGLVDTDMTAWARDAVPRGEMLNAADVAGAVRWLLGTSRQCVVPDIVFTRPGDVG